MKNPDTMRLAARLWLIFAFLFISLATLAIPPLTSPAFAQANGERSEIDYDAWEGAASQAETMLDDGDTTDAQLGALRSSVAKWRESFQIAQHPNTARIATLKSQLEALGPAPEEGETEVAELAARRSELTSAIAREQTPSIRAAEAYGRADSLIQQIDQKLRERQASVLLRLSPSPLLPSSWAAAASEPVHWANAATAEARDRLRSLPAGYMTDRLPVVLLLLIGAAVVVAAGRRFALSVPARLSARASPNIRAILLFFVSTLQILLPYLGVELAVRAAVTSGLFGAYFQPLIAAIPQAALTALIGRWIVTNLFPAEPTLPAPLRLSPAGNRKMRRQGTVLALLIGLFTLASPTILPLGGLMALSEPKAVPPQPFSEAAAAVWHMPLMLAGAVSLFRVGHILRNSLKNLQDDDIIYRHRIAAWFGVASRLIALIVPVLAMLGYVSAANSLLWPWLNTLGLIGLVLVLQTFIDDLWIIIKGDTEGAKNSLAPVLIGFSLAIASLPVLALIWGARLSDLAEAWMQIRTGIKVGGITISPAAILTFVIVFAVAYLITRTVQGAFRASILPKTRLDEGAQNAVVSGLGYIGIILAALLAITAAGIDMSSLAIVAGALSLGIGFGLQNIVSNFVSGIILLIERPIGVGDWIMVGGEHGTVRQISVRSTTIETFDRSDLIVPNSELVSGTVTNFTRGNLRGRVVIPITVSFDANSREVDALLIAIAEDQPLVMIDPAPSVYFRNFSANGMEFDLRVILSDINQFVSVATEIRHQIVERFRKAGIELPNATHKVRIEPVPADGQELPGDAPVSPSPLPDVEPART